MGLLDGSVTDSDQLERKITINHELNHYIQDLSIHACTTSKLNLEDGLVQIDLPSVIVDLKGIPLSES